MSVRTHPSVGDAGCGPRSASRARRTSSSPAALQGALDLPFGVAAREIASLVAKLLATCERELDLDPPVLEVEAGRHQREPALANLAVERGDLALVQEELAVARRGVVRDVALLVRGDVGPDEPGLAVADVGVRLVQSDPAVAEGLDLRSRQLKPGLETLEQLVVVPRAAILGEQLLSFDHADTLARERELDLSLPAPNLLHPDADRIAEPEAPAAAASDEAGPGDVELEVVAGETASGQVSCEDLAEADEEPGVDRADDLPLERVVPAELEQLPLEQPREADLVGEVLDLRSGSLALGRVLGERR